MTRWLFLAAAFAVWTLAPVDAEACSCLRPPAPADALHDASAVFTGTVTSVASGAPMSRNVTLEVMETFKGDLGSVTTVETPANSAACGFPFQPSQSFLVYADQLPDGTLAVTLCSRTTSLDRASAEVAELRSLPPREVVVAPTDEMLPQGRLDSADPDPVEPEPDQPGQPTEPGQPGQPGQPDKPDQPEDRASGATPAVVEEGRGATRVIRDADADEPVVNISAHAMFRYTLNFGARNSAELYNLRLTLEKSWDDFSFYAEPRFRQTPLRAFSPSNIWMQEAWVAYQPLEALGVRAGLVRTQFSRPWDNSWSGNLAYLNGLKLDPDYGIEVSATPKITENVSIDYAAQWLPASDGLNGFFATGDKLALLDALPGSQIVLDFDTTPGYIERNAFVGRLVPRLTFGDFTAAAGGSAYTADLVNADDRAGRKTAFGAEAELGWNGVSLYGEYIDTRIKMEDFGSPTLAWSHLAAGLAYTWTRDARWFQLAQARFNLSTAEYEPPVFPAPSEFFMTAGTYVRIHEMLGITAEYVRWTLGDAEVVDRIEWILHAYF